MQETYTLKHCQYPPPHLSQYVNKEVYLDHFGMVASAVASVSIWVSSLLWVGKVTYKMSGHLAMTTAVLHSNTSSFYGSSFSTEDSRWQYAFWQQLLKGTHARDFIVLFSQFFGIIQ